MKKVIVLAVLALAVNAMATMQITEWMYKSTANGGNAEFIEFTNVGSTAIDMTGWSFDDSSRTANSFSLSGFGTVAAGESVILTEWTTAAFRTEWGLASSVKVIGGLTQNLGNGDEINIYDASDILIDRLTYGSTPKTEKKSCSIPAVDYALTTASALWPLSFVGDSYGAWISASGDIASPGIIPEPATIAMLSLGMLLFRKTNRK
jgi:predicted extracellular nuclease